MEKFDEEEFSTEKFSAVEFSAGEFSGHQSRTLLKRHFIKTCSFLIFKCCFQFSDNFLYGIM